MPYSSSINSSKALLTAVISVDFVVSHRTILSNSDSASICRILLRSFKNFLSSSTSLTFWLRDNSLKTYSLMFVNLMAPCSYYVLESCISRILSSGLCGKIDSIIWFTLESSKSVSYPLENMVSGRLPSPRFLMMILNIMYSDISVDYRCINRNAESYRCRYRSRYNPTPWGK